FGKATLSKMQVHSLDYHRNKHHGRTNHSCCTGPVYEEDRMPRSVSHCSIGDTLSSSSAVFMTDDLFGQLRVPFGKPIKYWYYCSDTDRYLKIHYFKGERKPGCFRWNLRQQRITEDGSCQGFETANIIIRQDM
ncbi:hypothetical protein L9F63_025948, partial [Diploptera punctata]